MSGTDYSDYKPSIDPDLEKVAKAIYWAAYDLCLGPTYFHPKGFTLDVAWKKCSPEQREFCRHQARRAINAMAFE